MAPITMRLTAPLFACVLLSLPGLASASPTRPHLTVGQLQLSQLAQLTLPAPPAPSGATQAATPGPSPASRRAQKLQNALYIGDTWRLAGGVELSLHLTPNEEHCAPLARLTF